MALNPKVQSVLGARVDGLLSKRIGKQTYTVASYLIPNIEEKDPHFKGRRADLRIPTETKSSTRPAWRQMAIWPNLRKLAPKHICAEGVDLRTEETARAWISGIIAFKVADPGKEIHNYRPYIGRMSNSSFTICKRLPINLVRDFVSSCINGCFKYINIYGKPESWRLRQDPLFQIASIEARAIIAYKRKSNVSEQVQLVLAGLLSHINVKVSPLYSKESGESLE
jgi:hypothetical protein